jgi:hypothetical protein
MAVNVVGEKFGDWEIIEELPSDKYGNRKVTARCKCGVEHHRFLNAIRSGTSRRCRKCTYYERGGVSTGKHNLSHVPEYKVWCSMRERCYDKNNIGYENYGGRGIKVCDVWLGEDGFSNFIKDMGFRPSKTHQIDRINSNGNYTPSNCRWATQKEQARNRRSNKFLTIKGETKTLAEWAELSSFKYDTIKYRINHGWSAEDSVFGKQGYK